MRTVFLGAAAALTVGGIAVGAGITPQNPFFNDGSGENAKTAAAEKIPVPDYYSPSPAGSDRGTPSASRSGTHGSPSASVSPESTSASASASASASRTPTASGSPSSSAPTRATSAPAEKTSTAAPSERPTSSSPTAAPSERPTSSSPTATPTRSADTQSSEEAEVLSLVNRERADAGCSPVTADPALGDLAGDFSQDMAVRGFFDHTDPDGDDPWDRARQRGIDNLGAENIAQGQPSARAVMDSWMQSSGHRANILNCDFRTLGVGAHIADGGHWWTQEFGY